MEADRVRYILASYFRARLFKVFCSECVFNLCESFTRARVDQEACAIPDDELEDCEGLAVSGGGGVPGGLR